MNRKPGGNEKARVKKERHWRRMYQMCQAEDRQLVKRDISLMIGNVIIGLISDVVALSTNLQAKYQMN